MQGVADEVAQHEGGVGRNAYGQESLDESHERHGRAAPYLLVDRGHGAQQQVVVNLVVLRLAIPQDMDNILAHRLGRVEERGERLHFLGIDKGVHIFLCLPEKLMHGIDYLLVADLDRLPFQWGRGGGSDLLRLLHGKLGRPVLYRCVGQVGEILDDVLKNIPQALVGALQGADA